MAGHRPRSAERRPAREGDPVRLRALWPARRRHDCQRHHVSRAERGPRGGEGPRLRRRAHRAAVTARQQLGVQGSGRQLARPSRRGGLRSRRPARAALCAALAGHPGSPAAPRPALRRHGDLPGPARLGGAARARHHARALGGPVGQGRLRRARHRQGGSARPRHDLAPAGRHRDDRPARRPRGPRPPARRRSHRLRHDEAGGHHRRLPGREPRPDGHASAASPRALLRPRRPGGHHPAGSDRRRHGASVSPPPGRARGGHRAPPRSRANSRAHARGAALPGAAPPDGHGYRRLHRRRGGGAAPRLRLQALGARDEGGGAQAPRRHGAQGHHWRAGRGHHPLDHGICPVWVSRKSRGELRAAGVCERLPEGASPGGVLRGAAQQPAHGLLPSGHHRPRCRATRAGHFPSRRELLGLALRHRARRSRAARASLRARAQRGSGQANRGRAAARGRSTPWPIS